MSVTPAQFKAAKPQFASVDDSVVQMYLDLGGLFVDDSWPDSAEDPALIAITCHLMTLDGLGSDAESQGYASGAADYQSVKSGELTLTRSRASIDSSKDFFGWLAQTRCGQFYAQLLQMCKAGPRVATVSCGFMPSGYAKDWPLGTGGWPSWWWSGQ